MSALTGGAPDARHSAGVPRSAVPGPYAFRRIVVAFDASRMSCMGVQWAREIAQAHGSRVHVLTVTPPQGFLPQRPRRRGELDDQQVREAADEVASNLEKAGVETSAIGARGPVIEELLRGIRLGHADLVVAGSSRTGRSARIGSVARALLERTSVSVLVAKQAPQAEHRILVGTDGSPTSQAAIATGLALARAWGAPMDVVHVTPATVIDTSIPLNARYAEVAPLLRDTDQVECLAVSGPPAEAIASLAQRRHADLIVVGSSGAGGRKGLALGSVSARLVELSSLPVLVVRSVAT